MAGPAFWIAVACLGLLLTTLLVWIVTSCTRPKEFIRKWAAANGYELLSIEEGNPLEFLKYVETPYQKVFFVRVRCPREGERACYLVCGASVGVPAPFTDEIRVIWADDAPGSPLE